MLLFLTIVCSIFCTAWCQDDRIIVALSKTQAAELLKAAQVCGEKHGVNPNNLYLILTQQISNDEPHMKFVYCVCYDTGYIDENGHYNIDKMMKVTPTRGTRQDFLNNLNDCNKLTKDNKFETAYEMIVCFHRSYLPKVIA